jgi:integrase
MPKVKLTDGAVQRFKAAPGERIDYFDASFRGFGVRVSGPPAEAPASFPCRKSWFLFYRYKGKQKRLTFEPPYPALSLAEARKRAGNALAMLPDSDPAEAKADARRRDGDTVEKIVTEYLGRRPKPGKKPPSPRYLTETKRNFYNHVLPRWQYRCIRDITRRDINELLDAVVEEGTTVRDDDGSKRHVPGGPIAANRVLAAISALFNWCIGRGIIETTPAARVEKPSGEKDRDRALSDDEIRFLWPQFERRGYPFGSFFCMALLTGQRRDEVSRMRWDEIDEAERIWMLPGSRTKSGRPHVVPLSDSAMGLLAAARKSCEALAKTKGVPRGPFVFSTSIDAPISGYSRAKKKLDEDVAAARRVGELDSIPAWTIHDLRRTVATQLASLGVDRFIIGRILNHSDRSVTGIYDRHSYLNETRHALERWSARLAAIYDPEPLKVMVLAEKRARRA